MLAPVYFSFAYMLCKELRGYTVHERQADGAIYARIRHQHCPHPSNIPCTSIHRFFPRAFRNDQQPAYLAASHQFV
jgi:hypothetical protein